MPSQWTCSDRRAWKSAPPDTIGLPTTWMLSRTRSPAAAHKFAVTSLASGCWVCRAAADAACGISMIDLLPSVEQQQIVDSVGEFFARTLPVARLRAAATRRISDSTWKEIAALGW